MYDRAWVVVDGERVAEISECVTCWETRNPANRGRELTLTVMSYRILDPVLASLAGVSEADAATGGQHQENSGDGRRPGAAPEDAA